VILAERVRRAHRVIHAKQPALPSNGVLPLALPIVSIDHRPTAVTPAASFAAAPKRLTYETVPVKIRRRGRTPLTIAGTAAVLGGTASIAFAFVTPRVTALAAPSIAYPGTTAVVSYAAAGYGTLSYRLDARSGRRSGALAAGDGTLGVAIEPGDANSDVVVVIRSSGPLGSDARIARIRVLPRPRAAVLTVPSNDVHIDAFSLSAANVTSGDTIVVRYRSNATSGHVLVRDARGGLWQSVPLNARGVATLRAPAVALDAPFNVVLQAQRGVQTIENSLALVVNASIARSADTKSRPASVADIPAVVRSGALLVTSAGAGRLDTVIELSDRDGSSLRSASPGADGTTELRMPVVTEARSFLISVSYQKGAGRESSFHWIRVIPAAKPRSV
jgi:hypothetical protein